MQGLDSTKSGGPVPHARTAHGLTRSSHNAQPLWSKHGSASHARFSRGKYHSYHSPFFSDLASGPALRILGAVWFAHPEQPFVLTCTGLQDAEPVRQDSTSMTSESPSGGAPIAEADAAVRIPSALHPLSSGELQSEGAHGCTHGGVPAW
jgi:hypothetical protein